MCGVSICLLHQEFQPRFDQYVSDSCHKPSLAAVLQPTPSAIQNTDPTISTLTVDEYKQGPKSEYGRLAAIFPKNEHGHQCSLIEAPDITEKNGSEFHQDITEKNLPILPVLLKIFVKLCVVVIKDVCSCMYGCC